MSSSSSDEEAMRGAFVDMAPREKKFMIVSKMNGKVVDVAKGKKTEGASIIVYNRKDKENVNQLWYLDPSGHIRSALNNMTFMADSTGQPLKTSLKVEDPRARWKIEGNMIVNGNGLCLDIRGKSNSNGAELCAYKYNSGSNQLWDIKYV